MNNNVYFDPMQSQENGAQTTVTTDGNGVISSAMERAKAQAPQPDWSAASMPAGYPASSYGRRTEALRKLKESIEPMEKKDSAFMIMFFLWAFVFVDFAVMHFFNLGFTISFFALFAIVTAYLYKKEVKPSSFSLACGVLSLAGAVTLAVFRDVFINCIMVFLVASLFTIYSCGISATFRNREGSFKVLLDMLGGALIAPIANIPTVNTAFQKSVSKNKKLIHSLIGIAVSLPVLMVIIPLLVSSDVAFEGLVKAVLKNIGEYLLEAVLALIVTPYIISYMFSKKRNLNTGSEIVTRDYSGVRFSPNIVSVSFLCAISFTYLVYMFSQLAYFFSAFSGILPKGYEFSASGYARRGFFEMFAICCINILLLSLVNVFTKRLENSGQSKSVKALSTFISLFSVLMIITAMSKMKLYIDIYGLTKYRLLVSVFMIMLLIIFGFFMMHIFAPKKSYMQPIIIICSCIFIGISFADIDAQIAKYDVNAYKTGKIDSIDIYYLDELSASAVDYIIDLTTAEDEKVSESARNIIFNKINYDYNDKLKTDEKGVMVYTPNYDFREYNTVVDNACKTIRDFYNNLSDEDKLEYENSIYNSKRDNDYSFSDYYDSDISIEDTSVERGVLSGNAYKNESLGFEIGFPEEWRVTQPENSGKGFYPEINAFDENAKWVMLNISTTSRYSSIEEYKAEQVGENDDVEVIDLGTVTIGDYVYGAVDSVFKSTGDHNIILVAYADGAEITFFFNGFTENEMNSFISENFFDI